jgi:hypothetical protein
MKPLLLQPEGRASCGIGRGPSNALSPKCCGRGGHVCQDTDRRRWELCGARISLVPRGIGPTDRRRGVNWSTLPQTYPLSWFDSCSSDQRTSTGGRYLHLLLILQQNHFICDRYSKVRFQRWQAQQGYLLHVRSFFERIVWNDGYHTILLLET